MGIKNQVLASIVVSYLCLTTGMISTWASSVINLFSSENTTLNRPMTDTEVSLLGGLPSAASLFTIPLSGIFLDYFGRKYTCIIISLFQVVGWSVIVLFPYVEAVLIGNFINGFSFCMYMTVPVFVGEYCQENIRGTMTSGVLSLFPVGWMVSYLMGTLEYNVMNYSSLSMSVFGTLILFYMHESPLHLLKKGLEKEAAESIAHYRGVKVDSKEVQQEIENIKRTLNPELDDATPELEKLQPDLQKREKLTTWQFLKKSRSTRRALVLSLALFAAAVFQGQVVVQVYAEPLFAMAVPSMSTTVASVIFAVVNIFAALLVAVVIDRLGRRPLMIYSSLFTAVFAALLGSLIQLSWAPNWVTAIIIYLFCFTYTTGAGTIPYTMNAELFLPEIKNFATIASVEFSFLGFFVVLFIFHPVVSVLGLGPLFYIFSGTCVATAIFCSFFLPETKGLTVDVIQLQFYNPRSHNNV
ncbi:unnamed protein product [Leptosia nina]|uniref:Major facilitator superfamily (MFS) profile domain-containing protein n=1 Tax=Leptosia nina TaxID=320188 RepID=A0AAV1J1S5_9NEOP